MRYFWDIAEFPRGGSTRPSPVRGLRRRQRNHPRHEQNIIRLDVAMADVQPVQRGYAPSQLGGTGDAFAHRQGGVTQSLLHPVAGIMRHCNIETALPLGRNVEPAAWFPDLRRPRGRCAPRPDLGQDVVATTWGAAIQNVRI